MHSLIANLQLISLSAILFACPAADSIIPKFQIQEIDANVQIGYGVAIGDVNGDGRTDILLADKKQFVWYRNPDWHRFVMIDSLTERDNVCLAARDINGDGQVEVAVGAQWNPGETNDLELSGSVHYLVRPDDPEKLWEAIELHHEPTVHRMRWIKAGGSYSLIVLPLHGRGNKNGEGQGVRVLAYEVPADPQMEWPYAILDQSMHLTHNFDVVANDGIEELWIGGKEGAKILRHKDGRWISPNSDNLVVRDHGFGELRKGKTILAGVQPMHGNELAVYTNQGERRVLTDSLKQGHALACSDLLSQGHEQIIVGWREINANGSLGIKIFVSPHPDWSEWRSFWIDKNGMACEDLQVADMDGDGKKDIVASGRSTHNLRIYWNRTIAEKPRK